MEDWALSARGTRRPWRAYSRQTGRSRASGCCAVDAGTPIPSVPSYPLTPFASQPQPTFFFHTQRRTARRRQRDGEREQTLTCGLIRTKSINMTTKSCSTYLSQKLPHARHTVSRMLCPLAPAAPEYSVHSVSTGCRHSMQMGIFLPFACPARQSSCLGVMAGTVTWARSSSWRLEGFILSVDFEAVPTVHNTKLALSLAGLASGMVAY